MDTNFEDLLKFMRILNLPIHFTNCDICDNKKVCIIKKCKHSFEYNNHKYHDCDNNIFYCYECSQTNKNNNCKKCNLTSHNN